MAKMTGFKVYRGTKDTFISSGKATENADAIVFITGGTGNEANSCIFAQGTYFASITEMLKAINYVKGVTVGSQSYDASKGGGYIPFAASDNSTVALNVSNGTITVGLTDTFVTKVNNTSSDLGSKSDAANKEGSAFARIANLAALVSDLTGGSTDSIEGQIASAIDGLRTEILGTLATDDAKTLQAINDELNTLAAGINTINNAGYIKIGDVTAEINKLGGSDDDGSLVKVAVSSQGGEVTSVTVDETSLSTTLGLKADLDNGKIMASQLPDYILGQVLYGGLVTAGTATSITVTPSANFKSKFGVTTDSTTISSSDYSEYEGVYFIAQTNISSALALSGGVNVGDWIISTGSKWEKVDNTDAVTSVAGFTGNVTAQNLAISLSNDPNGYPLATKAAVDAKYTKPSTGITKTDLASAVQDSLNKADSAYQKPNGGISTDDLSSGVVQSLGKADSAYQKPASGIPKTDLDTNVQTSLTKADNAAPQSTTYTKTEVDAMWEWEEL